MIHKNQLTGSDLPILNKKTEEMFLYDELVNIGEKPEDYTVIGFIEMDNTAVELYERVYAKSDPN